MICNNLDPHLEVLVISYSMECCPDEEEDEESVACICIVCCIVVVCFLWLFVCLFVCLLFIRNGCGDEDEESVARIREKVGKQKGCMGPHQT